MAPSWHEFAEAIEAYPPRVLSLDVFDTCIVRRLAGDEAIEEAIKCSGRAEAAGELERELSRPVPGCVSALQQIRAVVPNVVFLSDTERSSELLIDLLRSLGIFQDGDRLVASCEVGETKSAGSLYSSDDYRDCWGDVDRLAGQRPVRPSEVVHLGNNQWSDGAMAAGAGLRPVLFVDAEPNRYEATYVPTTDQSGEPAATRGPALAAAARQVRLSLGAEQAVSGLSLDRLQAQQTGAGVSGLAMASFVLWVADQCRSREIDHVAFLSRDGELPLEVAKAIPEDHWGGRQLHYLHCSRLTWALAAASELGVDEWLRAGTSDGGAFLLNKQHEIPVATLIARAGLVGDDFDGALQGHEIFAGLDFTKPLPQGSADLWSTLLADAELAKLVAERSEARRELIVNYLEAHQFPKGRVALVDVGWRGRLAWQISAVLREMLGEEPVHLHFGGDKVTPEVDEAIEVERFAFDGYTPPSPVLTPVSCVETLTASGRPRVIEYQRTADGAVNLVFERVPVATDTVERGGRRRDLWIGALRTAAEVPSLKEMRSWGLSDDPLASETREVLGLWWNTPTEAEAQALRPLVFEHDEAGTSLRPLVTPYRLIELVRRSGVSHRQWVQGSEAVSNWIVRFALSLARPLQTARRSKKS